MAYTVDILNQKKVEANGLLSKIQIGGKIYEIKDLIARENIGTLSAGLDAVAADLAALSYVKATGQFADDVRLNLARAGLGQEAAGVTFVNRMGGQVVTVDDAVAAAKKVI